MRKTSSAVAVALALWCAGPGCVVVSYAQAVLKSHATPLTESAQTSAENGNSQGSCHSRQPTHRKPAKSESTAANPNEQLSVPWPSRSAVSCPLANGSIVTTSRPQTNDDQRFAAAAEASKLQSQSSQRLEPLVLPPKLSNQHQLYLRSCVFLI